MKIKPLFDRVVLKEAEKEVTTKSGIILSGAAAEKPDFFQVVAVGEGAYEDGKLVPMKVKAGDKVLVAKYAGNQVKIDGEEFSIVSQNDILAIVE
ncbi:MAG: co-chaperone GroES [Oscillospiraceae bacterium]|nr:co-chaperone GroES [Oscillospiraceae bacterium]